MRPGLHTMSRGIWIFPMSCSRLARRMSCEDMNLRSRRSARQVTGQQQPAFADILEHGAQTDLMADLPVLDAQLVGQFHGEVQHPGRVVIGELAAELEHQAVLLTASASSSPSRSWLR